MAPRVQDQLPIALGADWRIGSVVAEKKRHLVKVQLRTK
jgi:hypothetical protein